MYIHCPSVLLSAWNNSAPTGRIFTFWSVQSNIPKYIFYIVSCAALSCKLAVLFASPEHAYLNDVQVITMHMASWMLKDLTSFTRTRRPFPFMCCVQILAVCSNLKVTHLCIRIDRFKSLSVYRLSELQFLMIFHTYFRQTPGKCFNTLQSKLWTLILAVYELNICGSVHHA